MKKQTVAAALLSLLVLLGTVGCGGSNNQSSDDNEAQRIRKEREARAAKTANQNTGGSAGQTPEVKPSLKGWIKSAKLISEPVEEGIQMKVEAETTEALKDKDYLTYVFFKNGERVAEKKEALLEGAPYKRGDTVFAEVLFHRDEKTLARLTTNHVYIANIPPVLGNVTLPEVRGPGSYDFTVEAEDSDGDQLAFSLLPAAEGQPLPEGLSIDESSGTVTFVLGEKAAPKTLAFTIAADDGNGGLVKRTVSMTFKTEKVEKKSPEDNGN